MAPEVVRNGAEGTVVDKGCVMKTYSGFNELLNNYKSLPEAGWIYTDSKLKTENDISKGRFYVAENDEEEWDLDDTYSETFLEAPIFRAVIDNKLEHHPDSGSDDFMKATIHYLEEDDFLD